ncbi:MAG: replication-associated recombination protein A [Chloroflexi bacterium]|nr:replication-associated recombination protein A [Chloroflexota bacterium]
MMANERQGDLFSSGGGEAGHDFSPSKTGGAVPLADRFRPGKLSEYIGQDEILGPGTVLREAIEKDRIFSFIMWGPPGCGKTSLARIIAENTSNYFVEFSAVTSGIPEVRQIIKEAGKRLKFNGQKTILFMDEIHRFNKAQQDAFLPHVENGTVILIGATVENPHFAIIPPLASRLRFFAFKPLGRSEMEVLIDRVIEDDRGLKKENAVLPDDAKAFLIDSSGGDARFVMNALELAANMAPHEKDGKKLLSRELVADCIQKKVYYYDHTGSEHYDTVSAFIKSMRGGDPNAALYWMSRMMLAGEDPRFIARRIMIAASEEVGAADPLALMVAAAAAQAVERVGMPEARIILSQAVIHVACAPKSNSAYMAVNSAMKAAQDNPHLPVPLQLRNPVFKGAEEAGYGEGLLYPHDFPGHFVQQQYMPEEIGDAVFYNPGSQAYEAKFKERLGRWWPRLYPPSKND